MVLIILESGHGINYMNIQIIGIIAYITMCTLAILSCHKIATGRYPWDKQ